MTDNSDALPEGWVFKDPPPRKGRRGRAPRDFSALVAHPGRWVLIGSFGSSSGASSTRNAAEKRHGGAWEATNRPDPADEKRQLVYLRYLGDTQDAALKPGGPDPTPAVKDLPPPGPVRQITPPRTRFECSCGETFADEAGWKAHNDRLKPSEFRHHKLAARIA